MVSMTSARVPGTVKQSASGLLKTLHKKFLKSGKKLTLKQFARYFMSEEAKNTPFVAARVAIEKDVERVKDWFHNKSVNTSNPTLGVGNTRKKKGK